MYVRTYVFMCKKKGVCKLSFNVHSTGKRGFIKLQKGSVFPLENLLASCQ